MSVIATLEIESQIQKRRRIGRKIVKRRETRSTVDKKIKGEGQNEKKKKTRRKKKEPQKRRKKKRNQKKRKKKRMKK